mmetsp:Transcript_28234/g.60160  ORF Transcript_28234/g.60160 Transcript_28234/m.60160 type:complete len:597 (-) Transcript_28234:19-1809(-)
MCKKSIRHDATMSSAFYDELRVQLRTSFPATLSMLLYKVPWLLSLSFVGSIGSRELAAAALATTLCNVTGMSLSVGLSSAITTLTGQARGQLLARGEMMRKDDDEWRKGNDGMDETSPTAQVVVGNNASSVDETTPLTKNDCQKSDNTFSSIQHVDVHESPPILPLVYLYRGMLIQLAFVIPVGCWWLHGIKPMLLFLGQGEELSTMTEQYLRLLTPGLWGYSINWTLTAWLQVIELAHIPAYAALFGGLLHVPFNLFFIHTVGLGWLGVGVATTMFQVIQPIAMFSYIKGTAHGRSQLLQHSGAKGIGRSSLSFWCEAKVAISSFSGILQYLTLALPGILAISEWWASEICIFLAGKLSPNPDIALGAMALYQSLNASCFMFPVGMSVGGSARIGNHLGSGNIEAARASARVCVTGAGLLSATCGCILYFTPHSVFPSLFTSDANLIEMTSLLIPLLSIYVVGDGFQVALNGIIKGCGRQCVVVPIVIVAYWCVSLPLAWHFTFVRSSGTTDCHEQSLCGVVGLVAGMTIGTWVHFILLAIYCACMIDWRLEANLAKERLSFERVRGIDDKIILSTIEDDVTLAGITLVTATDII